MAMALDVRSVAGLGGDLIQRPQQLEPAGEAYFLPRAGPQACPETRTT